VTSYVHNRMLPKSTMAFASGLRPFGSFPAFQMFRSGLISIKSLTGKGTLSREQPHPLIYFNSLSFLDLSIFILCEPIERCDMRTACTSRSPLGRSGQASSYPDAVAFFQFNSRRPCRLQPLRTRTNGRFQIRLRPGLR
jgi:hypothetical protein